MQGKGAFYSLEALLLFMNAAELNNPPMKDYMKARFPFSSFLILGVETFGLAQPPASRGNRHPR